MADLCPHLSSLQWKFLAVFEAFEEPISLDVTGNLVPLPPAQMFDLLQSAEKSGWIHCTGNGFFSISEALPVDVRSRLRRINNRSRINAMINQLQADGTVEMLSSAAFARLLEKGGRSTEAIRQALEQHRVFIQNLNRKTSQKAINRMIKELIALEENDECAIEFIDLVIDLSNRIMSTHRLIALLKKALKTALKIDDQRRWTLINFRLGYVYYSEFQVSEAFSALSAGKARVEELNDQDLTSQSVGYIGLYYHIRGMYPVAVDYLKQASEAAALEDSIFAFPWASIYLSITEGYLGRFHSSIGRLDYLCHHTRIPGNDRLEAAVRSFAKYNLGMALLSSGNSDDPERLFKEILQGNTIDSALLDFNVTKALGYLFMKTDRVAEGLDLWNNSLKKWHVHREHMQYVSALILELLTRIEEEGYKAPEGWGFDDQFPVIEIGPNLHLKGVALRMKAVKIMDKDRKAAIECLQESERCLLQTGDKTQLSITRLEMARLVKCRGLTDMYNENAYSVLPGFAGISNEPIPRDIEAGSDTLSSDVQEEDSGVELMDNLFQLLGNLSPCSTVNEAFRLILLTLSDYFKAERACFFKMDSDTVKMTELPHSLHISEDDVISAGFYPCLKEINKCHRENRALFYGNSSRRGTKAMREPLSYFCIPLKIKKQLSGVLYFDNVYLDNVIDKTKRNVLSRLGSYLARYLQQVQLLAGSVISDRESVLKKSAEIRRQRYPDMIFQSSEMSSIMRKAGRMATSEATILINGETGVGKEMMARWLHENSYFRENPFVAVDFSTIPENLLESEVFGHEKGSFTGADRKKTGLIELADNGTLFIDEIGEIPLHLQVKLLRVLQEKQFYRVGGIKPVESDFRLLVATNRDLAKEISAGRFRQDLYYRLNVLNIEIPPLRERKADIVALARYFFDLYKKKHGRLALILLPEHEELLTGYDWPGNIRELKNAMERSVLASEDNRLEIDLQIHSTDRDYHPFDDEPTLDQLQTQYIKYILDKTKGRIGGPKGAARILGLKRTSLYTRMKKLGL